MEYAFTVTARELQPYIGDAVPGFFNPCLALKDSSGAVVAFADDESRFRPDPVLRFTPPRNDVYRLEIRDVLFRGRADFVYTIAVADCKAVKVPSADGIVARRGLVEEDHNRQAGAAYSRSYCAAAGFASRRSPYAKKNAVRSCARTVGRRDEQSVHGDCPPRRMRPDRRIQLHRSRDLCSGDHRPHWQRRSRLLLVA